MTRLLIALFVALGFGFAVSGPVSAQDVLNCDDFQFQEDAQAVYNADQSDPNGLDGNDNDGFVCESLPSRGTSGGGSTTGGTTDTTTTTNQTALPDTGTGAMAGTSSISLVVILAALGMLSLGVATRRTVRR